MVHPAPPTPETGAPLALQYLDLVAKDIAATEAQLREKQKLRLYYIRTARREGLSNQAIGDRLGLSEAAIRAITAKADEDNAA